MKRKQAKADISGRFLDLGRHGVLFVGVKIGTIGMRRHRPTRLFTHMQYLLGWNPIPAPLAHRFARYPKGTGGGGIAGKEMENSHDSHYCNQ